MEDSAHAQLAIQKKLNETFSETQIKNPAFSLRAFARRLELSPSALSEILKGKRRISKKMAGRVVTNLCLNPMEAKNLLDLFPDKVSRKESSARYHSPYQPLSMDQFHLIAEWYHFAILSLAETKDFVGDPQWIGKRLNIRPQEAQDAISRLERLKMLVRTTDGRLEPTYVEYTTTDNVADVSVRRAHAQNLEFAKRSLEEDPIEVRDLTATTMAIDVEKLPEAKKMIREFHDKLSAYLETGTHREVYKICVQLFPLSGRNGGGSYAN